MAIGQRRWQDHNGPGLAAGPSPVRRHASAFETEDEYCDSCRRGDFVTCRIAARVPGITYDGGYADYMIAPAEALALIPDELSAVEAGR
jgi:D-arabinose 1-dehydrogenase-like Zn-dependent alcohol dehydrogenase